MSDKAKTIVDEAIAAAGRLTDGANVYPRAFGMLESELRDLYGRLAVAELAQKRLAEAQAIIEALHAFHGETESVAWERLISHGLHVGRTEGGGYEVTGRRTSDIVFRGTEAELLRWVQTEGHVQEEVAEIHRDADFLAPAVEQRVRRAG